MDMSSKVSFLAMQADCKEGGIWTQKSVKNKFKIEELLDLPPKKNSRKRVFSSMPACLIVPFRKECLPTWWGIPGSQLAITVSKASTRQDGLKELHVQAFCPTVFWSPPQPTAACALIHCDQFEHEQFRRGLEDLVVPVWTGGSLPAVPVNVRPLHVDQAEPCSARWFQPLLHDISASPRTTPSPKATVRVAPYWL